MRGEHVHLPDGGRAGLRHPGLHGTPAGVDGAGGRPLRARTRLPHLPRARPLPPGIFLLGGNILHHVAGLFPLYTVL